MAKDANLPWCIIDDLNNVLSQKYKIGGAPYPNWLVEGFNEVVNEIGLIDLDLVGYRYMWERGRDTDTWTEIRLDRALTSGYWLSLFLGVKLYNVEETTSDHSPILLVPDEVKKIAGKRKFHFENAWLTEPWCKQLVTESWELGNNADIQTKIKHVSDNLFQWGQEITGKFSSRIKSCKVEMRKLRNCRNTESVHKYNELKNRLFLILEQREIFWRQRSKQLWLHSSDKNSKYFHASTSVRRRNNQISRLKDGRVVGSIRRVV